MNESELTGDSRDSVDDAMEEKLRQMFADEIVAQGARVPNASTIRLISQLVPQSRHLSDPATWLDLAETLALGVAVALLALWWDDATVGMQALLPWVGANRPWVADLALIGAAAALWTYCKRAQNLTINH